MMPKSTATRPALRVHEQVSLVHVGMEEAVAQRLLDEAAHDGLGDAPGIVTCRLERFDVAHWYAVDPFAGQDAPRGAVPVDHGHAEIGIGPGAFGEFRRGRRIPCAGRARAPRDRNRLDHRDGAQAPRLPGDALGDARGERERGKIAREFLLDAGPARPSPRPDAGDRRLSRICGLARWTPRRRARQRMRTAMRAACRVLAPLSSSHPPSGMAGAILQPSQREGDVVADQVGPRRHHLAELDMRPAEALQRAAQGLRPGGKPRSFLVRCRARSARTSPKAASHRGTRAGISASWRAQGAGDVDEAGEIAKHLNLPLVGR